MPRRYVPRDLLPQDRAEREREQDRKRYAEKQIASGFGYKPTVETPGVVAVPRQMLKFVDVVDSTVKQVKIAIEQGTAKSSSLDRKLKDADEYFKAKQEKEKKEEPPQR